MSEAGHLTAKPHVDWARRQPPTKPAGRGTLGGPLPEQARSKEFQHGIEGGIGGAEAGRCHSRDFLIFVLKGIVSAPPSIMRQHDEAQEPDVF